MKMIYNSLSKFIKVKSNGSLETCVVCGKKIYFASYACDTCWKSLFYAQQVKIVNEVDLTPIGSYIEVKL